MAAVIALFHQLMQTFELGNDTKTTNQQFHNTITCVGLVGLSFFYWFDLSGLPESIRFGHIAPGSLAEGIANAVIRSSQAGGWPLARLGALIVIGFLAMKLRTQPCWATAKLAALMFGLAAPWSPNGDDVVVAVLSGLLWPLQVLIIGIGFRQHLKRKPQVVPVDTKGLPEAEEDGASDSSPSTTGVEKNRPRARFAGEWQLRAGAEGTALGNARLAARYAGYLSVPLVLYFVWTTLGQLHDVLNRDWGILIVFIGLVTEAARWVVSGFVFGFLYDKIPGKIGPAKAACFTGLWVLSCLVPTAIARGLAVDLGPQFIYRSAQFALFILILSVLIDFSTVKSAGGKWQDLRDVYSARKYGEIVTVFAPVAFLTVTLVQQIITGSGWDVAESFLGGVAKVIPTGLPR